MENTPPDDCIIQCLKANYGIDVSVLTFLPLGADLNASVYKAETSHQSTYFVKLKRGHNHDKSLAIFQLLQEAKIQQIISPVKTIEGKSSIHMTDFTLIIYPFVDGQDGFSRSLPTEQWFVLGKTMRQIHDIEVPLSLQHQFRRETYSPKYRNAVRMFSKHLEGDLKDDAISLKLWNFMMDNLLVLNRLIDRTDQLAKKIQKEPLDFVLCHSDIHGGNILIDHHDNPYIVDWDDPIMAPRERDLMFFGGGVGNVWNNPHEESVFYEGYGEVAVNRTALAYYRHERIVEDIAVYTHEIFFTTARSEEKLEMYEHFIGMFEPNGVVDIAFKTDNTTLS